MPLPTTPAKVAIRGSLSTLRRISISGSDRAMTLIMNAKVVPRGGALANQRLYDGNDASGVGVHGDTHNDSSGH
ncbi:hypothetical protein [Thiolapillus sp.]|nr:hypothetical protein [Thiolapillus sp.]